MKNLKKDLVFVFFSAFLILVLQYTNRQEIDNHPPSKLSILNETSLLLTYDKNEVVIKFPKKISQTGSTIVNMGEKLVQDYYVDCWDGRKYKITTSSDSLDSFLVNGKTFLMKSKVVCP